VLNRPTASINVKTSSRVVVDQHTLPPVHARLRSRDSFPLFLRYVEGREDKGNHPGALRTEGILADGTRPWDTHGPWLRKTGITDNVRSPRGFDEGNSSAKPPVSSGLSPGAFGSVQQDGDDDSVEDLHLRH